MAILSFDPGGKQVENAETLFYRLVGECINQWSFVDRELFKICELLLGTDSKRTSIVFYSWVNINNHISLVDALLKNALPEDALHERWKPLRKQMYDLLDTRSIVAHQPAKRTGRADAVGRAFYEYSLHIEPAERLLGRTYKGLRGKNELHAADLRKHARGIEKLVKRLSKLHGSVERHLKRKK